MIPLTMDKPNPEAISFDETKGKKTESIISSGMPGPLSMNSTWQAVLYFLLLMKINLQT